MKVTCWLIEDEFENRIKRRKHPAYGNDFPYKISADLQGRTPKNAAEK